MTSPTPTRHDHVREDWKRALDRLSPDSPLRPFIRESWARCRTVGVEPDVSTPPRVSDEELQVRLQENRELLDCVRPHLHWLSAALATTSHVVYLADQDGIVLVSTGNDSELLSMAGLDPGHDWSETRMGTNGAGTALATGQPTAVVGPEHFVRAFAGCTCTAAPIRAPDGRLVGAIDLTTGNEPGAPERLALVTYAARMVERDLKARATAVAAEHGERLRLALEAGRLGCWDLDLEARTVRLDARARRILGRTAEDPLPLSEAVQTIHPDDRDRILRLVARSSSTDERYHTEVRVVRPDGSIRWVEMTGRTQCGEEGAEGSRRRTVGVVGDISERKAAERALVENEERLRGLYEAAQSALKERDSVLAIVSHDLRNPLNTIKMASGLLLEDIPEEKKQGQLAIIGRAVDQMTRLISDLMDISRIEAGGLRILPERCRADGLVRTAVQLLAPLAEARSVELRPETTTEVEVEADPDRILQVFTNLVVNAVEHTPADGTTILRAEAWEDGEVLFTVRDDGEGVASEHLTRLFDRYWQGEESGRRDGAGLGLAIARGIVQAHGGRIWAESEGPGHGTSFYFTLPIIPPPP